MIFPEGRREGTVAEVFDVLLEWREWLCIPILHRLYNCFQYKQGQSGRKGRDVRGEGCHRATELLKEELSTIPSVQESRL